LRRNATQITTSTVKAETVKNTGTKFDRLLLLILGVECTLSIGIAACVEPAVGSFAVVGVGPALGVGGKAVGIVVADLVEFTFLQH